MPTPVHDKLRAVAELSQTIGDFLDWLPNRNLHLGTPTDSGTYLYFAHPDTERLLAEFFEIDLVALEREKNALLDAQRARDEFRDRDTTRSGH